MKKLISSALCLSLLFLSSCSSNNNTAVSQNSKPAPDFQPLTDIQAERKNIYLIVKNLESSYWKVIVDGAEAAGNDFGCNVYYSGTYAETDWQSQQELLDDCINADADAVLLAPDDSVMLAEKITEIYSLGIPMILIDTVANTENYDICYMTDNLKAGQAAAEEMIYQLKNRGIKENENALVGIQVGATSSQTINERLAGFFQYWSQNAPAGWEIIQDIKCNEGDAEKAVVCAEELLDEYPEICGVFGSNNGSTAGFAKIVRERERNDITVIGFDYSDEIAELIDSPDYTAATMLQRQYDMSYMGIESALELISGKEADVKFMDTGVVTVNEETLDTPDVQEVMNHN